MSKSIPPLDVLVLGEHPSAYVAVDLLMSRAGVTVAHCTIPDQESPDRLVLINPQFFSLSKSLQKLKKKLPATMVWGVDFLADDGTTRGEYRCKNSAALVASYAQLRKAVSQQAKEAGAKLFTPKRLEVDCIDERGFEIKVDNQVLRPKAVLLAGELTREQAKVLALPEPFAAEVMRRYSFVRLRGSKWADPSPKPVVSMSLDLGRRLTWAWMLRGEDEVQLVVEQPAAADVGDAQPAPGELIREWADVLRRHGVLKTADGILDGDVVTMDIPSAGALSREIVCNRTLLFGPAAGFYTACMEDIYPNCWSATVCGGGDLRGVQGAALAGCAPAVS